MARKIGQHPSPASSQAFANRIWANWRYGQLNLIQTLCYSPGAEVNESSPPVTVAADLQARPSSAFQAEVRREWFAGTALHRQGKSAQQPLFSPLHGTSSLCCNQAGLSFAFESGLSPQKFAK
ncbi:hypothetical protein PGTUg99_016209 [Puccinia graminis f. sp. tritici]|uniref:Uncharacterized protein n=1 Tax=Puccinia graminis f. sp. tritici TaxID=56615 RepID=A0A5B0QLP6_PUCGR|nr:hypothetical protein PGTUg99_016209 [Puccinia graminis f. sp. tritici]